MLKLPISDSEAPRIIIAPLSNFAAGSAIMINWTTTDNREVQSQEIALLLDGGCGTFAILKPACTTPTIDHILLQAIKKPSVQHSANILENDKTTRVYFINNLLFRTP